MSSAQYITESRYDNRLIRSALQNYSEHITGTKDAMQFVLVPKPTSSVDYQNIVTAMAALSRYLFANVVTSQDAKLVARVKISIKK